MLTHLHIKNFKAWKDTGPIRLAPLTVIFGANSAGKSSLGHLLLALQQTARSTDRKRSLHLGDASSLIDLGTFADCLHGHDLQQVLSFELGWNLPRTLEVLDPLSPGSRYRGEHMQLDVALKANKAQQPEVQALRYVLSSDNTEALDVSLTRDERRKLHLSSSTYTFKMADGRKWPLEEPEKFYRLSDVSMARYKNAGFLADFALATEAMLERISYLGPLRDHPQRIYQWSGDTPASVGQRGEYAVAAILAAQGGERKINRKAGSHTKGFAEFIATWLKDLGVIHGFSVRPVAAGRKEYEVLVKTHAKAPEVKITDVGFGVSQVLPALVQAFYCPPHSTVWMEQPEIHLHPQVQAELADVFISATQARENGKAREVQLIIESHSEHFLNRLQRRVAEGKIESDQVAVYFCRREGSTTELEPLKLNMFGEIENWPENFFGNEMADIAGRALAAMQRKKEISQEGNSR
ncbi:AAA ATPase domain protein [compost metagenome]